ncbi:MAG TPA: hypothetical protein VFL91_21345 [Thermomicrobiales bacterium]|nr:hypothetical protein [Thermomicrobiales bacterium]
MARVRYRSKVRDYLRAHGITNAWFIRETGVDPNAFYHIESGRRVASASYRRLALRALADVGATAADLFEPLPPGETPHRAMPADVRARFERD